VRTFWLTTTLMTLSVATATAAVTAVLGTGQPQPSIFESAPGVPGAQCAATPGATGTCFSWSYELSLADNTKLDPSQSELQLFVVYDFAGFTGAWESASGSWTLMSQPAQGPTGTAGADLAHPYAWFPLTNTDPPDSPAVNNLVFQYIGPVVDETFTDIITIESIFNNPVPSIFRGQGTKVAPGTSEDDKAHGTGSSLTVPGPGEGGGGVPEPATMALIGSALGALGLLKRRRNS
jgi:hypothetical protein